MKIKKILLSTLVFAVAAIVCALTVGAEKQVIIRSMLQVPIPPQLLLTAALQQALQYRRNSTVLRLLRLNATHFVVTQSLQR